MCWNKLLLKLKLALQTVHVKRFSTLWSLECLVKVERRATLRPQTEQLKGFSPLWILTCVTTSPLLWKVLLQTEQLKHVLAEWHFIWVVKEFFQWHFLPQIEQKKWCLPAMQSLVCRQSTYKTETYITNSMWKFFLLYELLNVRSRLIFVWILFHIQNN